MSPTTAKSMAENRFAKQIIDILKSTADRVEGPRCEASIFLVLACCIMARSAAACSNPPCREVEPWIDSFESWVNDPSVDVRAYQEKLDNILDALPESHFTESFIAALNAATCAKNQITDACSFKFLWTRFCAEDAVAAMSEDQAARMVCAIDLISRQYRLSLRLASSR